MKNVLLIYPPFCTPASPPYSITNLYTFLALNQNKTDFQVNMIDLNAEFHKRKFGTYHSYFRNFKANYSSEEYTKVSNEYFKETKECYSKNNRAVVDNNNPELFEEMLELIKSQKPDIVGFSIVFSSQAFYAAALLKELKKLGIKTVIGGPCVNDKLRELADIDLKNEIEFLEYIRDEKLGHDKLKLNIIPDFTIYNYGDYFTPDIVIPIKASVSCYYKQCVFCTHHRNLDYFELSLDDVKKTMIKSGAKYFFFIDEMIHKTRLLEIAEQVKPLNVKWTCQLRPTKDLDLETLKILYESGLTIIMWGFESGSDRILKLMKKGTNVADIKQVLSDAKSAGIKNVIYTMFGFPTETKEEFMETLDFLKSEKDNIDLISSTIFGLQHEAPMMENPQDYSMANISFEKRTILEPKIKYVQNQGLSVKDTVKLKEKHKRSLDSFNKYPRNMNFFREHMFVLT